MDTWQHEPALYQLALSTHGLDWLNAWLRDQYEHHQVLYGLVTTLSWRSVDGGPLLNHMCLWLGGEIDPSAVRRPGYELSFYCKCQQLVFNNLLRSLALERLSEPQLELRTALDMGL